MLQFSELSKRNKEPSLHNLTFLLLLLRYHLYLTLDFIFRLVLYSHEDVSFNIIFLNVLEGIIQFHLSMWFKKTQIETPFKGDNVKAVIKTSNCVNLVLYFS